MGAAATAPLSSGSSWSIQLGEAAPGAKLVVMLPHLDRVGVDNTAAPGIRADRSVERAGELCRIADKQYHE